MRSIITDKLKKRVPWFVKIPAKIALSRLPLGSRRWQDLNLFRAGAMDDPRYAFSTFHKHYDAVGRINLQDRTVLELGPGNSMLTALFAYALGARRTVLVDSEALASEDPAILVQAEQMLSELGHPVPAVRGSRSVREFLEKLNATYLTQGIASLEALPGGEIDFLFSNAVLEHVRLFEFSSVIKQIRRVLRRDGIASHVIDFQDHLQNGLNNLRFSERVWESEFMARSGFYTNRIPWPTMRGIFEEADFQVEARLLERWPQGRLPTSQKRMTLQFKERLPEELMVMGAHAVLRPRPAVNPV